MNNFGRWSFRESNPKGTPKCLQSFLQKNHLSVSMIVVRLFLLGKVRPLPADEIAADNARLSKKDAQGLNMVQSKYMYRDKTLFVKKPQASCIDDALITTNAAGEVLVKVRTRTQLSPQVGDKFASLHGQKGVVGMDFHETDLPFTKEGIIPDIIMNPHGLPSRMTIGQLYESIYGKAAALSGKIMDGTPFHQRNLDEIYRILKEYGFHENGMEVMYDGRTGRKISQAIFIGPTYYQRLKHLVDDKIHSRARGHMDVLTQQPTKGFSRDGGLRFGEMERDCLISHGSGLFLMERMMDVSDGRRYVICGDCGLITCNNQVFYVKGGKGRFNSCTACSRPENNTINGYSMYTIKLPYATKLLFQELMSMNVRPRIIPASFPEDEEPALLSEVDAISKDTILTIAAVKAPESLVSERAQEQMKRMPMNMKDFANPLEIDYYNPAFYYDGVDKD